MSHSLNKLSNYPLVSICTPTYNRRPFIPFIKQCINNQTYPSEKIEWIIVDDGTDPIQDLVIDNPQVKYFYFEEKMSLGKKRNLMHSLTKGEIIVYMDDDDFYPPERVEHSVYMLLSNPNILIAGSSEMHIYFRNLDKIYQFGPYGKYHATAATFAFKRELLNITSYDENNCLAEEKHFLKGYTIPLIQLDTKQTILVCSHEHNSLNKEKLLEDKESCRIVDSPYKVDDFIVNNILKDFYTNSINTLLTAYEMGTLKHKPHIHEQLKMVEERRYKSNIQNLKIQLNQMSQHIQKLNDEYAKQLEMKDTLIKAQFIKIQTLKTELETIKNI
jgi:glycosyltransferase involved in cell wall biosynthesis